MKLDHIAIACDDLERGTKWVSDILGVPLVTGGEHLRYGTHNTLLGLADGLYLEVIAKNPGAAPTGRATWFGLDQFAGPPRPANWICAVDDIASVAAIAGPAHALTRGDLRWQITVPDDGRLPFDGAFPTCITWGEGVPHPATVLPVSGCVLHRWIVTHPQADQVAALAQLDDPRVAFRTGPQVQFAAEIDTPTGRKVLA